MNFSHHQKKAVQPTFTSGRKNKTQRNRVSALKENQSRVKPKKAQINADKIKQMDVKEN